MNFPLTILAGQSAARTLAERGWDPAIFDTLVGASGGAKLLGLGHLDRFIFGDYLQRSEHPMALYGSSIGSWRHAALASADPAKTIATLQERYLNQTWSENDKRSTTEIVDALCDWVLAEILTMENIESICNHPRFSSHIVTARGKGLNASRQRPLTALGMGLSAAANLAGRRWLALGFQRVVFSSRPGREFAFSDFDTGDVVLSPANLRDALLASGSIPLLMSGRQNIDGAPPGTYWDGGIIDYHFDFANVATQGLVLYPHFSSSTTKGWFDKALRWRINDARSLDRTVIVAPSPDYLAALPHGKIPDRRDFPKMSQRDRVAYWQSCLDASEQLADAFSEVVQSDDPLRQVTTLEAK